MNKYFLIILLSLFTTLSVMYLLKSDATPAITYFPFDTKASFELAETTLESNLNPQNSSNILTWKSKSVSNEPFYIRQDISLLYKNGIFKGVLNSWKQNNNTIELNSGFNYTNNGNFQAISFHYGEIHKNNTIKSIYKMSYDNLNTGTDKAKTQIDDKLFQHWYELITYFKINPSAYEAVPLTDLHKYSGQPLPQLTQDETDKVIGQLWEGLYKNYVIPLLEQKNKLANHYVPLILFDNQAKYLLVLFEWNDEQIKLIQKY